MLTRRDFFKNGLWPLGALCLPAAPLTGFDLPDTGPASHKSESPLSIRLKSITPQTPWTLIKQIKVRFRTFHCQGMVKIGSDFWVSSVEMTPVNGVIDRSSGAGHLFRISDSGDKLAEVSIGEPAIFHPSGIDFDGHHIWIAAAAYRPDSEAIIYRFDPDSQQLTEVFRWQDHVGGVAANPDDHTLHGISWASRKFYSWDLSPEGQLRKPYPSPAQLARLNPAFYIDYQDNQYLGGQEMLYTGLAVYKDPKDNKFALGGLEIVDLDKGLPVHQTPVPLWSPVTGRPMTTNPSCFELTRENKVRACFMPDDDDSTIYVYEV